jgi:DNA-binding CsgD family transcriptional regulator
MRDDESLLRFATQSNNGHAIAATGKESSVASLVRSPAWRMLIESLELSPREIEIVECILNLEDDEKSMALRLTMSSRTVHTHLERLYRKLRVTTRAQLMARVLVAYAALMSTSARGPVGCSADS